MLEMPEDSVKVEMSVYLKENSEFFQIPAAFWYKASYRAILVETSFLYFVKVIEKLKKTITIA